jgi:hypothetical protein
MIPYVLDVTPVTEHVKVRERREMGSLAVPEEQDIGELESGDELIEESGAQRQNEFSNWRCLAPIWSASGHGVSILCTELVTWPRVSVILPSMSSNVIA